MAHRDVVDRRRGPARERADLLPKGGAPAKEGRRIGRGYLIPPGPMLALYGRLPCRRPTGIRPKFDVLEVIEGALRRGRGILDGRRLGRR